GQGRFTDDIRLPGTLYVGLVRSPMAHARITGIETKAALDLEGVVAIYTGADVQGMLQAPLPMAWPVTEDIKLPPHWPVTADKARYVGDAVAVVVARDRDLLEDAIELVAVDYQALDPVLDIEKAAIGIAPVHGT